MSAGQIVYWAAVSSCGLSYSGGQLRDIEGIRTRMQVTQEPIFRRFWYPVVRVAAIQSQPYAFELLGEPLVIWLTAEGMPAAARDRCCHRSARLSLGQVVDGQIRCPYHGWGFDAAGACVHWPQQPGDRPISASYRVPAYRCTVRYDYVWVCLDEPLQPIPDIPQADTPGFRFIHEFYEPWDCSGLRLMENSFDNAHPHFVHARTFGLHQEPIPPAPKLLEKTAYGLRMQYELPVFNTELQQQNLQMGDRRTVRISEGRWFMPFARSLTITYPNGLIHCIVTVATPIHDGRSQIVQFCLRNDTEADAPAADIIAFDRAVTLEDRAILESTEASTAIDLRAEQHMPSDQPGVIMRQQLASLLRSGDSASSRSPVPV